MLHTHYPLKHYTLPQATVYLGLSPYVGQSAGTALMERIDKARRTACLRKRIGKALHQNSKNESLTNIGCLSWFMFFIFSFLHLQGLLLPTLL